MSELVNDLLREIGKAASGKNAPQDTPRILAEALRKLRESQVEHAEARIEKLSERVRRDKRLLDTLREYAAT